MLIKRGDAQILSIVEEEDLLEEQKESFKALTNKQVKKSTVVENKKEKNN